MKDGLGGRSENSSLRAVRAKREADEAGRLTALKHILTRCLTSFSHRQGVPQRRALA